MTKLEEYAKRLGVETSSTRGDTLTDINAGKAGYNQYLADVEAATTAKQEAKDNESFLEKIGRYLGNGGAQDTSLGLNQGFNQAVEAYKNMPADNKPKDDWTDEERWAFGEKYATNTEDAYAFAKELNSRKAKEQKQKQEEALAKWSGKNIGTGILGSAASLGINAVMGSAGYLDALAQRAAGREVEQNVILPHEISGAMQGGIANKLNEKGGTINEKVPIFGGKGWGDVYGLGMSIGQSALAGATGGSAGTLVQFFGMSASQGVSDALARGATGDQAIAFGTVSGLAEAIPEMLSMDKILGIASAEGVQNLFKNILKQAGEEAGEEFTTSLITNVADNWIMGGKSQFYQTVNQLVASGMSVEEAKKKAWLQTIEDIAFDTLSGAASGGISGAGATAINRIDQQFFQTEKNEAAKKILAPEQSKLIEDAKQYDTTKKRASALEKKVADGKELSGYELRMLSSQLNEAKRTKDVDTVRKAIVEQMKTEGVSESQAKTLGEIALNKAIGNEISKVQDLMLKRNPAAMKVYNQMSEEMMQSGLGDSEWAKNTPIEKLRAQNKTSMSERDTEQRVQSGIERLKDEIASRYGVDTKEYKINMDSIEGKFGEIENKIVYKPGENSKIHVDGISSSLTQDDIVELSAVEKIANELGIDIHVYETKVDKKTGERVYTDKTGKKLSDSGFYDPNDNSIHIDLRAGENGEGTMLYTASHEVVHFIKENAAEHYAALEELVTKELIQGGFSIDTLIEEQRKILRQNGWSGEESDFEAVAREEMVAEACQSFLASKNAVAEIKALKTENKGLWNALKKFFTSLFTKISNVYKTVPPDSEQGKYIADMRKAVKPIRDAFMEGAVEAVKKSASNKKTNINNNTDTKTTEKKTVKSQARVTSEHDTAYLDAVKRGDMETAQRMVDEAAKANGYTVRAYHGRTADFTVFDKNKIGSGATLFASQGKGFYFTANREVADKYASRSKDTGNVLDAFLKISKPFVFTDKSNAEVNKLLNSFAETIGSSFNVSEYSNFVDFEKRTGTVLSRIVTNNGESFTSFLEKKGYDGIVYTSFNYDTMQSDLTYIVFNSEQIKSADPVTYDDNGNVIPLSERFNEKSKDIRHKARSITTKDSLGNELSAEQQEYFKDSAVRDKKGNLLVLYHGTTADFNTFKKGDVGFHFGTKGAARGRVGYGKNVNLKEVYLNITNPIVFDEDLGSWDADFRLTRELYERGILTWEEAETVLLTDNKQYRRTTEAANKKLASVLQSKGYDGISYTNTFESKTPTTSYIIFDSNQAKLITNTEPTLDKDIRHKSRSYTAGQMAQVKANLSHNKVYSKKSAMELVSKIAPGIRNRSFEDLSTRLWEGLNAYTTFDDKITFATDMAEIFVDRMVVDTLVKHSEWDSAVERMAYLKPAIGTIQFSDTDISELKYILDKDYPRLRGRWGYKTPSDGSFKRAYGLDEFISDLSREMPGMEHLAEMHPAEALIEVDKLYTDLQEQIKEKYESAYGDMSDAELNEIKQMIATEIMGAYNTLGEKTRIAKYLEEKFTFYQSRIDYWKAENAKTHNISRWNGIISTKALQIRDLKKGAFYNATQYHQDVFKDSIEKLANIQWRGNLKKTQRVSEIFAELSKWYTIQNPMLYKENADNNLYSDTIATYISKIADSKGAFDENTYAMVYDVMNHLYTMMRNYNKIFRAGRWEDAPDLVNEYLKIMEQTKRNRNALTRVQTVYNTEFLEPMAVARHADGYDPNGFFTQTMEDLRSASINASIGEMKLRREYDAFIDANKKYLTNAAKETVNYRGHEIPKLQLIGLYMTMKREHARAGLALNGFEYTKKNKWWDSEDKVFVKGYVTPGDNVTPDIINQATMTEMSTIEKSFTDTDKQYIAILEKLFNEDLKALKVERDMERQGYTNATLDYYYPIIRGAMAENIDTSKISDQNRATNASFNKNTVKGAKQRLVIISADAMVNRHITDMCKYYYMSQAIENYNVLYNCDVSGNANDPLNIAKIVQENKVWEKDVAYFKQLVKDMQGIREPQTVVEKFIESMRGNYAKFALGLNLKVLCTQFSSMIAAGDVISFGSILSKSTLTVSTADLYKYCPLAEVRSYDKTVLKAMTLTDKFGKFSEMFTAGISKVDSLVVSRLFAACQVEAQKLGHGELGTEENKIAAGKLLEKVIIETQQNSYATERSQAMRSKNELLKAITMFTADGMKIVSRMYDAFGELQAAKDSKDTARIKKARKQFAKSVAVAVNIAVYMTAIAWAFGWIYDREEEEDETGWDKMLHLTLDVTGNFISALPVVSELYDYMVNGFEVEGVAFDTFNNLLNGINNIRKDLESIVTQSGERTIEDINRDLRTLLYGVGQATGLPFRNVYNLARGIIGNTSSKAGYYLDSKFYKTNLSSDLDDALTRGDNSKANYILGLLYGERVNKDVSNAQREEIIRLAKLDYNVLPKDLPDKIKRDGKEYVLTATQKDKLSEEYAKVVAQIDNLISSNFYLSLSNKDKAYMIDYYHDKYYEMAVNKALGFTDAKAPLYNAIGFRTYARLAYTTKGIESDKDKNGNTITGSKKEKVIAAVAKTGITEEKRLLYIASLGYKLTESEQKKLIKYLNSLGVGASTKKKLAELCGYEYKNGKIYP